MAASKSSMSMLFPPLTEEEKRYQTLSKSLLHSLKRHGSFPKQLAAVDAETLELTLIEICRDIKREDACSPGRGVIAGSYLSKSCLRILWCPARL